MAKVQKTYTQEFKREAVRLALSSGKSIAQVARELGIATAPSISGAKNWRTTGQKPFPAVDTRRLWRKKIAV